MVIVVIVIIYCRDHCHHHRHYCLYDLLRVSRSMAMRGGIVVFSIIAGALMAMRLAAVRKRPASVLSEFVRRPARHDSAIVMKRPASRAHLPSQSMAELQVYDE